MKIHTLFILIIGVLIFPSILIAGDLTYECTINNVYELDDFGALETPSWHDGFTGSKFKVSRETGRIIGKTLTTEFSKEIKVLNFGSKEYSFKSIAIFNNGIQLIEIQEFKSGSKKPFISASLGGAGVVTGSCE